MNERILEGFCSAGLTVDRSKFPAFLFFIVVTYKPLARTQNPFSGGKKQHQTTFTLQSMLVSKLFSSLIDSLRSKAKCRISHTKAYFENVVTNFTTDTELGLPVAIQLYLSDEERELEHWGENELCETIIQRIAP